MPAAVSPLPLDIQTTHHAATVTDYYPDENDVSSDTDSSTTSDTDESVNCSDDSFSAEFPDPDSPMFTTSLDSHSDHDQAAPTVSLIDDQPPPLACNACDDFDAQPSTSTFMSASVIDDTTQKYSTTADYLPPLISPAVSLSTPISSPPLSPVPASVSLPTSPSHVSSSPIPVSPDPFRSSHDISSDTPIPDVPVSPAPCTSDTSSSFSFSSSDASSYSFHYADNLDASAPFSSLDLDPDDTFVYVLDVEIQPNERDPSKPTVEVFITDVYEGQPPTEPKLHQAYTPVGEKKKGVVYKRKYRKAADRVHPVATQLPEEFRIVRNITGDPLKDLPELPTHPPDFTPGKRYTQERHDNLNLNPDGFLTDEEEKLAHHLVKLQEEALAWDESERGQFNPEFFPPVRIPTVDHTPWVYKNIPIPPGLHDELVKIIREKIASGAYEPSNAPYRSRWFCVIKRDGSSLRVVHDLRPFNAVTIGDVSVPPITEQLIESFGARSCYASLDLFGAYDQRLVHPDSRDPTTFQTPLGSYRHTRLVMGHTNSVQVMQGDVNYTLRDEIPTYTDPFIDDVPVKGPPTRYELPDGSYETIPDNPNIRRFVWEHLTNVNRILQRMKYAGTTFSGKKLEICVPTIIILGQRCTYEGRVPNETKVQKIKDWPRPENVTHVRGFLGTCGLVRIFIKDFASHARPLVNLTRKLILFVFVEEHEESMQTLKDLVIYSPALRPIDYTQLWEVIVRATSSPEVR